MERLTRKSHTSDMVWFIDREHKSGYAEREPCDMNAHHARLRLQSWQNTKTWRNKENC